MGSSGPSVQPTHSLPASCHGGADADHEGRHEGEGPEGPEGHEGHEGHEGDEGQVCDCKGQDGQGGCLPWRQGQDLWRYDQGQADQEQGGEDRLQGSVCQGQEELRQTGWCLAQGLHGGAQGPRRPGVLCHWRQVRARQGPLRQGQVPLQGMSGSEFVPEALYICKVPALYSSSLSWLTLSSRGCSRSWHVTTTTAVQEAANKKKNRNQNKIEIISKTKSEPTQ